MKTVRPKKITLNSAIAGKVAIEAVAGYRTTFLMNQRACRDGMTNDKGYDDAVVATGDRDESAADATAVSAEAPPLHGAVERDMKV